MSMQDSLDREQKEYSLSGHYENKSQKWAMQNLYKHQLDAFLNEKNKQKQVEREKEMREKLEYNERAQSNKESERVKEQAYKNYYSMLLTNQEQLQSNYVNPYSIRDTMKDQHISHSVHEGEQRMRDWEIEENRRLNEKKSMYKNALMSQIEERQKLQSRHREQQHKEKEQFRKYGRLPNQIHVYERNKHLEDMAKYKEDLDRVKNDQMVYRSRSLNTEQSVHLPSSQHNAIINPVSYNIQNPYILREMNRQSYLANRGNQNMPMS